MSDEQQEKLAKLDREYYRIVKSDSYKVLYVAQGTKHKDNQAKPSFRVLTTSALGI